MPIEYVMSVRRALPLLAFLLTVLGGAAATLLLGPAPRADAAPRPSNDSRTPYGEMNLAWSEPGMIGLVGWTKDPDVNRPIDVVVAVDNGGGMVVRTAGVYNPFLPGKYAEKFRSYLIAMPVPPGPHTMCVAALNVGRGNPHRLLGCKSFVVAGADPVGNLEDVALLSNGDRVSVVGWALDPESASAAAVDVTVDGTVAGRLTASHGRADIGAAFPALGDQHGFAGEVPISPGRRRVCAVARNIGRGGDATVGCRDVDVPVSSPFGMLEGVVASGGGLDVVGWAGDPDQRSPIQVRISDEVIGSIDDQVTYTVTTSVARPDVAAATGLHGTTGFGRTISVTVPGRHRICAVALNVGMGRDQSLGCREVEVSDLRPFANIEALTPQSSSLRIRGWALSSETRTDGVQLRVAVDGAVTNTTTSVARPDVAAAYAPANPNAGFDITIPVSAGRHSVCVTLVGGPPRAGHVSGDRALPCGSVIVGSVAVGTSGIAGIPVPVGPGGALSEIDRDAGVTTRLRDGSVLWLFGDSVDFDANGAMKYFVSGTGAWAAADSPTVTRDAVAPNGLPYLLAAPGAGFPACSPSMPHRAMWPLSAVTVPSGSRDRVIVFLANMCLADGQHFEAKGMSIAEWYYDPANPPVAQPVQLTVINENVGLPRAYGTASVMGADGWLYLYQCDRPANPVNLAGFGPCRVARVLPGDVANTSAYRYWNGGSTWQTNDAGYQVSMPPGSAAGYRYPASAFTVAFDSIHNAYVMVYSPWPGFIDRVVVRVSSSPQGPWSEPVEVTLPGCNNTVAGQTKACYAGTAQPAYSTSTELGLGFYDQAIPADRNRGQYMVVRVPFVIEL